LPPGALLMRPSPIATVALTALSSLALIACAPAPAPADAQGPATAASATATSANLGPAAAIPVAEAPFTVEVLDDFEMPWAMAVLPGNGGMLITERSGRLLLRGPQDLAEATTVAGTPAVSFAGQGGLGDVVLSPNFARDRLVYLSWAEEGPGGKGAAVGRGRLSADGARLEGFTTIWRATPFVSGNGHFGHRLAFGPDGMLYIATGDRQAFEPAQDMAGTLGKIIRLNPDGSVPADNPFAARGGVSAQIWALGLRNPLGIAFDDAGRLWEVEMGPAGGDELNIITRGANYGYPTVSNGRHYPSDRGGAEIPDHSPGDGFAAPRLWWNPAMSPGGMMIYRGRAFPAWRGDAFIAALGGRALIRVDLDGAQARAGDRWAMNARIRAVATGPDGSILLLEDGRSGSEGRLLRLRPH
jgi:aldose sugar dehydrogenase